MTDNAQFDRFRRLRSDDTARLSRAQTEAVPSSTVGGFFRALTSGTYARMRQRDVAAKARISLTYVCDIENGLRRLGVEKLLQIAAALDVDITYFLK